MSEEHTSAPLLEEQMQKATRPTGPVLAIVMSFVFVMGGGAVVGGILHPIMNLGKSGGGGAQSFGVQFATTFGFALAPLLLLWWMRKREGRPFRTLGFWRSGMGTQLGRGALVGIAMVSIVVFGAVLTGNASLGSANASALVLTGVLLVGFAVQGSTEEIIGRGFVLQSAALKWGIPAAMVTQTLVFAAMHGANPGVGLVPIMNLLLVAVFLGFWALAENGLWGVCAFHTIWNWSLGNFWGSKVSGQEIETAFLQFRPTAGSSDLLTGGAFGAEGSLLTTLVLAVGTAVAYRAYRQDRAQRAQRI